MSEPPTASASWRPRLYSPRNLRFFYTPYVIGLSHRLAWGVPNTVLHRMYQETVGPVHVEVGPGNGHFLAALPDPRPVRSLHLLDLHQGPLRVTRRRLEGRWSVHTHQADALDRWPLPDAHADSVIASMVVHTLPGESITAKTMLFDQAARVLRPGGVFAGATVLARGVTPNRLAQHMMRVYNARGWFDNEGDSLADLELALAERFTDVHIRVRGCTALWRGEAR